MRSMMRLTVALALLAALPAAAQTGTWTAVASSGAIDEASLAAYAVNGPNLSHLGTSLTTIVSRYNVTNTLGGGVSDKPGWNRLELGYFDNSAGGQVRATLFRVDPCTGAQTLLCSVTSADAASSTCVTCGFTAPIDFSAHLYFVEVTVSRSTAGVTPIARTLRLF